jgi:hypothetical protein
MHFEAQIDLNNGAQDEMKRGIAEHAGWTFQFAWALDRAALEIRLLRIGARKYPGAHKRGWSRSIRGLGTKHFYFADARQERHPSAAILRRRIILRIP